MASSNIKSFSVFGLFGTHDVHIPFDENIKILIGENGLGKTQILNMFYCTLDRKFEKLIDYSFEKLELKFCDDNSISISRSEIEEIFFKNPLAANLIDKIGMPKFLKLKEELADKTISSYQLRNDPRLRQLSAELPYSTARIVDIVRRLSDENEDNFYGNLQERRKIIEDQLNSIKIMYFPTYRRVEENLINLGYDDEQFDREDNRLINFGMTDVRKRFDEIENEIDKLLKEGFSKISGEILSQLVKGFNETDREILNRIDENDIEIILARVGEQLSEADKSNIRDIVVNKKIEKIEKDSLLYFLQKLIEIYEKQKPLDDFIKVYRDICNKYLINKNVFYDESNIRIFVKSDLSGEEIELSKLSSGEKQIISILSKIYLAKDEQRFIVLFDEPELSLSIFWQKQLLPDILNSDKCDFLLAVTHSPFIFENELDRYAVGLNEYVKPLKTVTA